LFWRFRDAGDLYWNTLVAWLALVFYNALEVNDGAVKVPGDATLRTILDRLAEIF
jgi:hypothetical protein